MPTPVPVQDITDEEYFCLQVNSYWAGIITGLLAPALEPRFWEGDSEEITHALQQIEELIGQMETICS